MKKTIALLCALLLVLLAVAGCDKPSPAGEPTPEPTAEAAATQEAATQEPEQPSAPADVPEETPLPIETELVQLGELPLWVAMPVSWKGNTTLESLASENPDVTADIAMHFSPPNVELSQDARIGQFYVVEDAKWSAVDGHLDRPAVMLGSANGYTVAYSGASDNPYVIGTDAEKIFGELMLRNKAAAAVLTVHGAAQ